MLRFSLLICFLLKVYSVLGGITRAEVIHLFPNKRIILLFDKHDNEKNSAQLDSFWNELVRYSNAGDKFHILNEQPENLCLNSEKSKAIITDILEKIHLYKPDNITYENVEIRSKSDAAYFLLLNEGWDLPKNYLYLSGNGVSNLGKLTFKDVIDEYYSYYQELSYFVLSLSENNELMQTCQQELDLSYRFMQDVLNILNKCSISQETTVINFSPFYNKRYTKFSSNLALEILRAFSGLLDIHIFKKIVNSNEKNLIVIAGGAHLHAVRRYLFRFKENKLLKSINLYRKNFISEDYILEAKDFEDIFQTTYEPSNSFLSYLLSCFGSNS